MEQLEEKQNRKAHAKSGDKDLKEGWFVDLDLNFNNICFYD